LHSSFALVQRRSICNCASSEARLFLVPGNRLCRSLALDPPDRLNLHDLVYGRGELVNTVNIHEAKTQLSRLVDQAAKGEPFIIAKAGKPLVKVTPLDTPTGKQVRRLGFLAGQFSVPDDFDEMGGAEIERIFGGDL
jgi:prevent-host-death family protein